MLSIWIGRAGAGKSRRVLETMARQRSRRPQVLLVPEHISHEAEVDLCRALGPTASRDAEVLSFQSLGSRVLAQTGGLAEFTLDGGGKLLTMRLALQELHSRLKVFGRPSQRAAFLRQLTDLTEEFYAYEITPQALWQQVEDMEGAMGDKLRDLALLYAAYDGKLHAEGVDARSRLQKLRDRLAESDYLRGKDVYLDGFSYLNKLEESVLEQVMRQAESVTVTLLGDRTEGTLFQNALRQRQRLERMARQLGTECEIVWLTGSGKGPLAHLEKHLLGEDMPYEGDDCRQQVALWECGTVYGEVERTAAQIRKLVASRACRWRDIAVTARNMEVYGPVIESVFQRDGIPAYISRRSDILAKPPLTMLLGAVDAVTGGFRREDMFRYLKTGMAGITAEECDLLENYVILWSIRGNMWLRDTEWTANPDGYGQEMTPERQQRLAEVNRIREKVRSTLLPLSDGLKDRPKARDKAEMLYIFAEESGVPQRLKETAEELLRQGQAQLAEEYSQLLISACSERQIILTAADSEGILFGEAANLQGLLFKHVYIMGLREGEFPRSKNENWIYNDRERAELSGVGVELDNTACAYAEDKFFFAAVAAMATETLTLSWYSDDTAGASAYIEDVERLYAAGCITRSRAGRIGWQEALSEQELLLGITQKDTCHNWLLERLGADWTLRSSIERIREQGDSVYKGVFEDVQLQRAINEAVGGLFSASHLETYAQCPYRFLLSYVWKQQQYEELTETVEPAVEGSLLHDVLARFMAGHLHEKLTKYPPTELISQLDDIMTSVCDEYITGKKIAVTDFWPSQRRKLNLLLRRWLQRELVYQKKWEPFVPVKIEWDFGRNGSAPLVLEVNGGKIYLNGRIDRIDSDGNGIFVTDYKRSQTPSGSELTEGLDLQIPVYLMALAALEPQSKVLGGGYYSLKEAKRKGGFAMQTLGKTPFTTNNKPFSDAEDQWLAFADFCRTTVRGYINTLQQGNFPPAPRKNCPEYCPGKDICRAYGELAAEGGEENV